MREDLGCACVLVLACLCISSLHTQHTDVGVCLVCSLYLFDSTVVSSRILWTLMCRCPVVLANKLLVCG